MPTENLDLTAQATPLHEIAKDLKRFWILWREARIYSLPTPWRYACDLYRRPHSDQCWEDRRKAAARYAAYRRRWPRYCLYCNAEGGKSLITLPTTWVDGELNSAGYWDPCPRCYAQGFCPRCGYSHGLDSRFASAIQSVFADGLRIHVVRRTRWAPGCSQCGFDPNNPDIAPGFYDCVGECREGIIGTLGL